MILKQRDLQLWEEAKPYLDVRNNDEHTIVAYGVALAFLKDIPEADESIVLPAIILHDVGWKKIPPDLLLAAIGTRPTRPELVRQHEIEGVKIARDILERCKPEGVDIEAVLAIIDGHDTTREARSLNDAVMKDADKGWRCTPHGMRIICGWYGFDQAGYVEAMEKTSNSRMLTVQGQALVEAFTGSLRAELELQHYVGKT